jgi:hypothetical protein
MAVNPYGAVWATDFGNPKVISAYSDSVISGGQLVFASGVAGLVSSGLDSFATSDVKVRAGASGLQYLGVALATVGSNALVPVAINGVFLLQARAPVSGGYTVAALGDDSVGFCTGSEMSIGKALTTSASGGFALVLLN